MKMCDNCIAWLLLYVSFSDASFSVPGLDGTVYQQEGDLNLGGIFRVHQYSASQLCNEKVHSQTRSDFVLFVLFYLIIKYCDIFEGES